MKSSLALIALSLAGAVSAAPMNDKSHSDDSHAPAEKYVKPPTFPFEFTSTVIAWAGAETIVNNSQVTVPGLPGGYGTFAFGLNSKEDVICYVGPSRLVSVHLLTRQNISVYIKGNYSSPAVTATHIHEAAVGRAGPPRIAFPNPRPLNNVSIDEYSWRRSVGCLTGPFRTGIVNNGSEYTDSPWGRVELTRNSRQWYRLHDRQA